MYSLVSMWHFKCIHFGTRVRTCLSHLFLQISECVSSIGYNKIALILRAYGNHIR